MNKPTCCDCNKDATHIVNDACLVCDWHAKSAAADGFLVEEATLEEMNQLLENHRKGIW